MPSGYNVLYTKEMESWIREHEGVDFDKNLVIRFNEHFNTSITRGNYSDKRRRMGIKGTGDGRYTVERKPHNQKPVGYIKIMGKYFYIKTEDGWKMLHRVMYERYHNVKLTYDDKVVFLDGNRNNMAKENLQLCTGAEMMVMAVHDMFTTNPDLTKLNIDIAEVMVTVNKKKRRHKHA